VVAEAYKFNVPLLWCNTFENSQDNMQSYFSINDPNLVIETIKKAEDSQAIIVRLYECHGSRGSANLKTGLSFKSANLCNLLEDDAQELKINGDEIDIDYSPFQIISVKLS
jgi:alpha-mannosidase